MFEMDGQVVQVVKVEHIKLARAGAVIKARLRNVMTGSIVDQSFRSGDKYKTVRIENREAQYLYSDGTHHHFMDPETYDQIAIDEDMLESVLPLLKEGSTVFLLRYDVDLTVTATDPGFKGDTVSGATKMATLETGAKIQVPLFIQTGDVIRVDTRDQTYVERA
jgi:elongation factor P